LQITLNRHIVGFFVSGLWLGNYLLYSHIHISDEWHSVTALQICHHWQIVHSGGVALPNRVDELINTIF
jgi:hypothetical protein